LRGESSDHRTVARPSRAPERHDVFIGRDTELARIGAIYDHDGSGRVAIVAVQGMAGVGKTYLAHELYARHADRFGSYQHVVLDPERPGAVSTWTSMLGERAGLDVGRASEEAVATALRAQRALIHVDNVDSIAAAELVASLARALVGVPMLVTGRYSELGTARGSGWTRIELAPFDPDAALDLLRAELDGAAVQVPEAELRELVRQVAGLPLALHLAAGYLRRGVTVARFLSRLRAHRLELGPRDPADHVLGDRARGVLSTSFAISRELILAETGASDAWQSALVALGWAPRAGFGRSLGAAITGLDEASGAFEDFIDAAVALSLVRRLRPEERATAAWAVHPLLGEFLRAGTERAEVDARIGAWVERHVSDEVAERAARWDALAAETTAICEWLGSASADAVRALLPSAWDFVVSRGPVGPWLEAAQRVRRAGSCRSGAGDSEAARHVLWAICQLAFRAGELEIVRDAATEMEHLARAVHDERDRALALGQIADVLAARGELAEALQIMREEELPVYERLGDVRSRAITLGQIADVLAARGELEGALQIMREGVLPIFDLLGDVRSRAIRLGRIADVLVARGELDEALRIRHEEELPVYERLGDVRARTVALGKIADVFARRGELDKALRIRREEELPVYERLGDVRARANTLRKIADMLAARGELDEALRIMREEELPVYERLGDVWSRAITLGQIADVLFARGELDEALRIRREEQLPVYERLGDVRSRAITLGQIADVLFARGELDEAMRIRREEVLPVFERLGDVWSRAVTLGKIADVLFARGELEEAMRIRREEALPVFERLGDVRSRAIMLGRIADVHAARGELDEALRIRREEALPVFERLGDVRSRATTLGKIADALADRGELDRALAMWSEALAIFERLGASGSIETARRRIERLQACAPGAPLKT
jgi:tetratricopeptide (TPR) repeat protein